MIPGAASFLARSDLEVVGLVGVGHFASHFYFLVLPPLFPILSEVFGVSYTRLGFALAVMGVTSALVQTPVGFLVDRYGARRFLIAGLVASGVSLIGVGLFPTYEALLVLMLLFGIGDSVIHPADYAILNKRVDPRRMGRAFSVHTLAGHLGFAAAPVTVIALAEWLGWRGAFVLSAAVSVAVAALTAALLRDDPPGGPIAPRPRETLAETVRGVATVLRNRQLHLLLPLNACAYSAVMTLLALWGAPWLAHTHGLGAVGAADVMMGMAVSLMAGSLAYGWLGWCIGAGKSVVLAGAAATTAIYAAIACGLIRGPASAAAAICLIGMLGGYAALMLNHIRALFPARLVGRGLTAANLFNFGGSGIIQAISGAIVGAWPEDPGGAHPPEAYAALFAFLAAIVALSAVVYAFARPVARPDG